MKRRYWFFGLILLCVILFVGCSTSEWDEYPLDNGYALIRSHPTDHAHLAVSEGQVLIDAPVEGFAAADDGFVFRKTVDGKYIYFLLNTESGELLYAYDWDEVKEMGIPEEPDWHEVDTLEGKWFSSSRNRQSAGLALCILIAILMLAFTIFTWKRRTAMRLLIQIATLLAALFGAFINAFLLAASQIT